MTRNKQPAQLHEIIEEHKGKTYREYFTVKGDLVVFEIMSEDGTPEIVSAHIGRGGPEVAARHLQREMIISGRIRPSKPTEHVRIWIIQEHASLGLSRLLRFFLGLSILLFFSDTWIDHLSTLHSPVISELGDPKANITIRMMESEDLGRKNDVRKSAG